jgi:hypothetical protein
MASVLRQFFFCVTAGISMMIGAQCVHAFYRPLDDLENLVQQKLEEKRKELQNK